MVVVAIDSEVGKMLSSSSDIAVVDQKGVKLLGPLSLVVEVVDGKGVDMHFAE